MAHAYDREWLACEGHERNLSEVLIALGPQSPVSGIMYLLELARVMSSRSPGPRLKWGMEWGWPKCVVFYSTTSNAQEAGMVELSGE
jgi:hypothetical protein